MKLIRTLNKANKQTIMKKIDSLMEDRNIYAMPVYLPYTMTMFNCWAFIQGDETVFLLNDYFHANEEVQADERSFMGGPPMYFNDDHCWTSPVYVIRLLCHAYKEVMRMAGRNAGEVHCVVLTNAKILNRGDMEDLWKWLGVTVIDDVSCRIKNADNGHGRMNFFLENMDLATWTLDPDHDRIVENYLPWEERKREWEEEEMRREIECERIPWDED